MRNGGFSNTFTVVVGNMLIYLNTADFNSFRGYLLVNEAIVNSRA